MKSTLFNTHWFSKLSWHLKIPNCVFGTVPRRSLLLLALTATLVGNGVGCAKSPLVTVTNQSSVTISNVVVSGTGFSEALSSLAPGKSLDLYVKPKGETGLRLVFDAGEKHMDSGNQGYFEGNGAYRVKAVVSTNLTVMVSTDLKHY